MLSIKVPAFLLLIFMLVSCKPEPLNISGLAEGFDTKAFISGEIDSMKHKKYALEKNLLTNGSEERMVVDKPDWEKELAAFSSLSLGATPDLSYKISSQEINGSVETIFSSVDSTLSLKLLQVTFTEGKPEKLFAIRSTSNMYYRSRDTLEYYRGGNYRISVWNDPRIGRGTVFVLTGKSIKN